MLSPILSRSGTGLGGSGRWPGGSVPGPGGSVPGTSNPVAEATSAAQTQNLLSTVLAQDHFFSDSLSLHLTSKTHKVTMMMLTAVEPKTFTSASAADLMKVRYVSPQTEWDTPSTGIVPGTSASRHEYGNMPKKVLGLSLYSP